MKLFVIAFPGHAGRLWPLLTYPWVRRDKCRRSGHETAVSVGTSDSSSARLWRLLGWRLVARSEMTS
jgi:hypothetical protein